MNDEILDSKYRTTKRTMYATMYEAYYEEDDDAYNEVMALNPEIFWSELKDFLTYLKEAGRNIDVIKQKLVENAKTSLKAQCILGQFDNILRHPTVPHGQKAENREGKRFKSNYKHDSGTAEAINQMSNVVCWGN